MQGLRDSFPSSPALAHSTWETKRLPWLASFSLCQPPSKMFWGKQSRVEKVTYNHLPPTSLPGRQLSPPTEHGRVFHPKTPTRRMEGQEAALGKPKALAQPPHSKGLGPEGP